MKTKFVLDYSCRDFQAASFSWIQWRIYQCPACGFFSLVPLRRFNTRFGFPVSIIFQLFGCKISKIDPNFFKSFPNLLQLNLNNNCLTSLDGFENMPKLFVLSIEGNSLRKVSRKLFIKPFSGQLFKQRWFSGRILACHAGGPGSIPGRCIFCFEMFFEKL